MVLANPIYGAHTYIYGSGQPYVSAASQRSVINTKLKKYPISKYSLPLYAPGFLHTTNSHRLQSKEHELHRNTTKDAEREKGWLVVKWKH
jgi:hypothetical protein